MHAKCIMGSVMSKSLLTLSLIFQKFCFTRFKTQYINLLMTLKQNFCDTQIELGTASESRSNTPNAPCMYLQ